MKKVSEYKALTCAIYVMWISCRTTCFWKSTKAIHIYWLFQKAWTRAYFHPFFLPQDVHTKSLISLLSSLSHENKWGFPDKGTMCGKYMGKYMGRKWSISGWKKTWLYPNKRATELYFTFCAIWVYHVQNSNHISDRNLIFAVSQSYTNIL